MGEAEPAFAEGVRRLLGPSVICSLKMPVRDLSYGWIRTYRIAQLGRRIGLSRRNHDPNERPRPYRHSASRQQRLPSGNGSHLVLLSKAISGVVGGSRPDNRPSSLAFRESIRHHAARPNYHRLEFAGTVSL